MAEVVDIIREYSKEFIMYPINKRLDKMENNFKSKLEQMELLINSNIHKSNMMDEILKTIQSKDFEQFKTTQKNIRERLHQLEGKSDFIYKTIEEKHQQFSEMFNQKEIKINSIINQMTESLKQNEIIRHQLNKDIESIETKSQQNCSLLNEEIAKMKTQIDGVTDNFHHEIDVKIDQLKVENEEKASCKKLEEIEEINHYKLKSLKSSKDERKQMDKVLFTVANKIDQHRQKIKRMTAEASGLLTKVDKLEDEVKVIMTRLNFPIGDFHEEKISSYIASNSPDFTWEINGIKKFIQEKTQIKSQIFELVRYPAKAQVKLAIGSTLASINLILEERDSDPVKVKPAVTFIIKDLSGNNKHLIRRYDVYYGDKEYYGRHLCPVSLLEKYVINDSIVIEVHLEPLEISKYYATDDGILQWKIINYKQKKQNAIDGLIEYEPSPYFLTSSNGYRILVTMLLNGYGDYEGIGPSAHVVFLTGEHDSTLNHSFLHKTTFIIFNPLDSSKNYLRTAEMDIKYKDYYCIDILPHDKLENEGFLKDDCLLLKVMIEPINP
ncbi:hypothetical protein CHUAL_012110 [Chamberlinius hualienensis]